MNISPHDAEEALATIQRVSKKTRQSIASSGADTSLIVTGLIWLIGFVCTQFLSGAILIYIWVGISLLGLGVATTLGMRRGKRMRSPTAGATAKRISMVWLLLWVFCVSAIAISWPIDGHQITILVVLFVITGWLAMSLLLYLAPVWPGLILIVLILLGYFLLPEWFYLWMGLLGGGGLIALGWYIRSRW
ncbi:MAG: hypothetical protein JW987_05375 [Anaerolineaceae bacterium]|nr:hypothetical protein [Anaerolineaceae bacterium]